MDRIRKRSLGYAGFFLCTALLTLCLLIGCTDATGGADTTVDDTTALATEPLTEPNTAPDTADLNVTEPMTEPVTEAQTDVATAAETAPETELKGWEPDTGTFNEGKVDYVKNDDGTVTATQREGYTLGLDITDKNDIVAICYSVWFDHILGAGSEPVTDWYNVTEVLEGKRDWGPSPVFHYWAKPALGYYRSSDKSVIRTHMTQLYAAGVDFIILDHTNLHDGYLGDTNLYNNMIRNPMVALFDTIMEMRAEGLGTPYVVVWCGTNDGPLYRDMYHSYYNQEKWKDCFVYWDGLPLLLTTHHLPDNFPLKDENLFTVRSMWGLSVNYGAGQWSYLNPDIQGAITYGADGKPEQVGVSTAAQRNYMASGVANNMTNTDAVGRKGGKTWYTQWYFAFQVRPKIVTLTWWNEWTAQRLSIGGGQYAFTDNYNQEYSRDIEPMEGGHGDQYYQWLIQYISAYKGHLECPMLVEAGEEESALSMLRRIIRNLQDLGFME